MRPRRHDRARLGRQLCERVARGELVSEVCADLGIDISSPWRWGEDDENFRASYARARELQAHAVAEQALVAARGVDDYARAVVLVLEREEAQLDDLSGPAREAHRNFVNALRHGAIQRDRLRVDTLKWSASKLAPRVYGDRTAHEHTGKDGTPITLAVRYDDEAADSQ